jgi:Flp pilus assembly protein TadD
MAGCGAKPDPASEALHKGIFSLDAGDLDSAIVARTEAIRLAPTRPDPYAGRAATCRALGDEAKAVADERKAKELMK